MDQMLGCTLLRHLRARWGGADSLVASAATVECSNRGMQVKYGYNSHFPKTPKTPSAATVACFPRLVRLGKESESKRRKEEQKERAQKKAARDAQQEVLYLQP